MKIFSFTFASFFLLATYVSALRTRDGNDAPIERARFLEDGDETKSGKSKKGDFCSSGYCPEHLVDYVFKSWGGDSTFYNAVRNTPEGCVLTPINTKAELEIVAAMAQENAWVGVVKSATTAYDQGPVSGVPYLEERKDLAEGWTNIVDGSALACGDIDDWATLNLTEFNTWWAPVYEPNNNSPPQTRLHIYGQSAAADVAGLLRDVQPIITAGQNVSAAVYKCCLDIEALCTDVRYYAPY